MLMLENESLLSELLGSAETAEDCDAAEALIAERESKRGAKWCVETLGEVAEFFGLSPQTVRTWRMQSPPLPGSPGRWSLPEIVQWKLERTAINDLATAKKEQDLKLGAIELQQRELELAKDKGDLLDRAQVELWAATALIEAREMVMALPEMLATSSPPEQRDFIRTETDRHCRDVLVALRRRLESDSIASDAAPTAAAEDSVE